MLSEFFQNPFLLMALFAGLLASVASGIVGSYVVVKRIVFISGGISHSVLGGMGLCLYLQRTYNLPWLNPIYGALLTALLAAYLIGWIHLNYHQREDTVIGALWASGMALGVIFVSLTPGYNVELMNFLFGNILWTTLPDLVTLLVLDAIIITIVLLLHTKFLAICFDEKQSFLQMLPVRPLYFLLLSLIAITTVLLIQVIGAILVIAMLSLPAGIAGSFTKRLSTMMILATLVSFFFTLIGLFTSYILNWPPGATISLTTTLAFLIHLPVKKLVA
ncbi:MAG: metal ABC transporter permease [Simkaniaceae bacterium]